MRHRPIEFPIAMEAFLAVVPECDRAAARRVLEAADWNVERAVNFYFEGRVFVDVDGRPEPTDPTTEESREETNSKRASNDDDDDEDEDEIVVVSVSGRRPRPTVALVRGAADCRDLFAGAVPVGEASVSELESSEIGSEASEQFRRAVRGCEDAGVCFTDPDFPPTAQSIDGRQVGRNFGNNVSIVCQCDPPSRAKLCKVRKDGKNQGRNFYGCATRKCNFFRWAGKALRHTDQASRLTWRRFDGQEHKASGRFRAQDILQGATGDCWFLAGLSVIAVREDLVRRIFPLAAQRPDLGLHQVNLFADGGWSSIIVDNCLPINEKGEPAFAKLPKGTELWPALVEKAYAKLGGSYLGISGGFVSEAMFDMTGFPTEVINMDLPGFDSELTFARLLSFASLRFPIGCSTQRRGLRGSDGLVDCHAYSCLEVVELNNMKVGHQPKIQDFFSGEGGRDAKRRRAEPEIEAAAAGGHGTLRLLRIRNPWGKREWNGDFSDESEKWTNALRARLGKTSKNDGTFWMPWSEFIMRFSILEICHAHQGWHSTSKRVTFSAPSRREWCQCKWFEFEVFDRTWAFLSFLQRSKRGRSRDNFWFLDVSFSVFCRGCLIEQVSLLLLLLALFLASDLVSSSQVWGGQNKTVWKELLLDPGRYTVAAFTLAPRGEDADLSMRIFSAKPAVLAEKALPLTALAPVIHRALMHEDLCGWPGHRITPNLTLIVASPKNTSVFFLAVNSGEAWARIRLGVEASPRDMRKVSQEVLVSIPPRTQRILCVLTPRKLGKHEYKYSWEAAGEVAADDFLDGAGGDWAFRAVPALARPEGSGVCSPKGEGKGRFVCKSRTFGSAQE